MFKNTIWSIISNYKSRSLFVRNFFLILFLVITPLVVMSLVVYQKMDQTAEEEIMLQNLNSVNRVEETIHNIIKDTNRLATQLSLQDNVKFFLYTNYISEEIDNIKKTLQMYTNEFDHIDSIYVYSELKNSLITNQSISPYVTFPDQSWFERYEQINENKADIQSRSYKEWFPYYLSLLRPVYIDDQKMGTVIINLNVRNLRKLIEGDSGSNFENIYIVDNKDGKILYNKDLLKHHSDFSELYSRELFESSEFISESMVINKNEYLVSKSNVEEFDWSILTFLSLSDYEEKKKSIRNYIYVFILISICFAFLISILISIKTYRPLRDVITFLNNPEHSLKSKGKINKNELRYIYKKIKSNYLNHTFMESELDKRLKLLNRAQMMALQAQISPHFLSNTLETMRWNAMKLTNGENELSKMTISLSQLLRLTLGTEKSIISIKQEIELSEKYIEIMKYRYKELFKVIWDIDEHLLEYEIIQLTLQPIIENAIYHGIRPQKKHGTINVQVSEEDACILISVTDNGQGIERETLQDYNEKMSEKYNLSGEHVGVRNVNQRIKLVFGEEYGVKIMSERGVGTRVIVRIPKYRFEE